MLRKVGPDEPAKHNHHFKHMTAVGEHIGPDVWRWYYNAVGKGEAVIVDTWWQTENGGFLAASCPPTRQHVQSETLTPGELPRQLTPEDAAEIKAFGEAE